MAGSMLQRRALRLQSPVLNATRLQRLVTPRKHPQTRLFSSSSKTRGFSSVLQFATIQPSDGQLTPADFRFKAALVVNTASNCQHAAQLKQLQRLHEEYSDRGLVVVAVPCNDFAGGEAAGSSDQILARYREFGVTFPIAAVTPVTKDKAHPLFKKIADKYSSSVAPTWNFDKFLVDHRGAMRAVFPTDTEPLVKEVVAEIEEVLEELPRGLEPGQELVEEEEYDYEEEDDSDDEDSDEEEDSDDDGEKRRRN